MMRVYAMRQGQLGRHPMNFAARLQATIDLLTEVEGTSHPADAVTSSFFRARRYIEGQFQGEIIELLYALLRHRARLDWWLDRLGHQRAARTVVLAWLVLAERKTPEQIKSLFNGTKFAPAALTAQEYDLAMGLQGGTLTHAEMPEGVALECPDWVIAPLHRRFGDKFAHELAATLTPPPLDLRINPMKTTRAAVLRDLQDLGLRAKPTPMAPNGVRLNARIALGRIKGLKTGEIEIQDEGSQLVTQLVDAKAGERVVDFCAGAGGKSLAIGVQMQGKGHLVACDISEGRLKRCAERLRRAGLHNAETRLLTSETDKWIKRRKGTFDRVLVDAPCSGTGTWRRNPDARWRPWDADGLDNLVALQARILTSAARLVKPNGRLVYATCSMLPEENEGQVAAFLAATPHFRLVPLAEVDPKLAEASQGDFLSLTPARHDTDGFFAAVFERVG